MDNRDIYDNRLSHCTAIPIKQIKAILKEYLNTSARRLSLFTQYPSLREIFTFFNSAESASYFLPPEDHTYSEDIGSLVIAWDIYKHDLLGFVVGGKGRMKIETVDKVNNIQFLKGSCISSHQSKSKAVKISDKTHLILINHMNDACLNRTDVDNIIMSIDRLTEDLSASS